MDDVVLVEDLARYAHAHVPDEACHLFGAYVGAGDGVEARVQRAPAAVILA